MPWRPLKQKLQRSGTKATARELRGRWVVQFLGYRGLSRVVLMRRYRVKRPYIPVRVRSSGWGAEQQAGVPQKALPLSSVNMCAAALGSSDCTSQLCAFSCHLLSAFPSGP